MISQQYAWRCSVQQALARKADALQKHDIIEGENLIVLKDSPNGGIDSAEIKQLIEMNLE